MVENDFFYHEDLLIISKMKNHLQQPELQITSRKTYLILLSFGKDVYLILKGRVGEE